MLWKRQIGVLLALCTIDLCIAFWDYEQGEVVYTRNGGVYGRCIVANGRVITEFLGIPFAETPIGDNRFKKPVPVESWLGVYHATTKPPPCMQFSLTNLPWIPKSEPSEDCLYLNIWVPKGRTGYYFKGQTNDLPVMVWIHGGGYYSGSSDDDLYDGATLASVGDVVVVTMNYRVGSFGFLASMTEDAPGNMGLYDQNLAMKWVKDNIEYFGGDPNSITLFGESVGSISVGLHLLSPKSKNLFHKAIMQSSAPYHPLLAINGTVAAFKSNIFATAVGCADNATNIFTDPSKVVECLKNKEAMDLAKVEGAMLEKLPGFFTPFSGDEFMPKSPIDILESGEFEDSIPIIYGNNKDEGSIFLTQVLPEYFTMENAIDLNLVVGNMIIHGFFQNDTHPTPDVVANFYLNNTAADDSNKILERVHQSFGDYVFVCPGVFFVEKMKNVYFYLFTHRPSNTKAGHWMGTAHFEDVAFVFGSPIKNPQFYTPEEIQFSRDIIDKWTTFARNGKPHKSECEPSWPKYNSETRRYKILSPESLEEGQGPHTEACNFWRSYFVPPS